jgi:hypothetical protein
MPILTATLDQILVLTDTNAATLRGDRLRGNAVAAFGCERPLLDQRWLLVDGVAMLVRDDLSKSMLRKGAANVTRAFWDKWAMALSRVEHERKAYVFSVAEQQDGPWWCGLGPANELADFVKTQPPLRKLIVVNLAQILLDMQRRATKAKLDISFGSVVPPPDDPSFVRWLEEFAKRREALQQKYDPLHAKPPKPPSVEQRRAIELMSCSLN